MNCSQAALDLLESYETEKESALADAKERSFIAIQNNDIRTAYKDYLLFQRKYVQSDRSSRNWEVKILDHILKSSPPALKYLSESGLIAIRQAVCMSKLWKNEENPSNWISPTIETGLFARGYQAVHYG